MKPNHNINLENKYLLDEKEAARILGFSTRCLQAWRYRRVGPKYIRFSRRGIRYRFEDLIEFIEENVCSDQYLEKRRGKK